jgi:IS30 family transposase
MNGLVRQYLPKGTDLSVYSQQELDAIADEINNRPRKGLGVRSPLTVYRELLANSQQHSALIHSNQGCCTSLLNPPFNYIGVS